MDRWKPLKGKTFCYATFNRNEVVINDFFWHLEGVLHDANIKSLAADQNDFISSLFDYGSDRGNRKDTFVKDFLSVHPLNINVFRLFSLVACASYFEHYLNQTLRLSLYSNVGVVFSQPQTLDGVKVLKSKEIFPFQGILKPLLEGKWKARSAKINSLFGVRIYSIERHLTTLEWQRLTRNAVAHQFGLEGDMRFIEQIDDSYFERKNITIDADKIKECLKIIREVVDEIEEKIAGPNIGSFELLLFIHNFKNDIDSFKSKLPTKYKSASLEKMISIFSRDAGLQNVSRADARALISFYNKA